MKKTSADFYLNLALKNQGHPVSVPLAGSPFVRIGSSLTSDVLINSPEISPRHAEILSGPEGFVLREPGEGRERKLAPGQSQNLGILSISLSSGKPCLSPPAARKSRTKISPGRLRLILFALIGLALVGLFLLPAPKAPGPPSLREENTGSPEPGPGPGANSSPSSPGGESISLPPGERISRARNSLALGEQRLRDRKISIENLGLARAEFQKAVDLLEDLPPAPDLLTALNARLQETEGFLEEEFRRRKFSAEQAIRFQDFDRAELELKNIQKLLGNPNDPRSRSAQERLKEIGRAN
ncbi:MAG: FHA domain-containing protein [Proteobacteria bacterium]|nr:FHA domain-containing protein [Pseudomonadota bacterium]